MRVIFRRHKDINSDYRTKNKCIGVFFAKQDKDQEPDPKMGYFGSDEYYISITRKDEYYPTSVSFDKKEWNDIKNAIDEFIKEEEGK